MVGTGWETGSSARENAATRSREVPSLSARRPMASIFNSPSSAEGSGPSVPVMKAFRISVRAASCAASKARAGAQSKSAAMKAVWRGLTSPV